MVQCWLVVTPGSKPSFLSGDSFMRSLFAGVVVATALCIVTDVALATSVDGKMLLTVWKNGQQSQSFELSDKSRITGKCAEPAEGRRVEINIDKDNRHRVFRCEDSSKVRVTIDQPHRVIVADKVAIDK
jgi:hypothetical protein